MGYRQFSTEQEEEFVLTAQEMGISPAIRYLGFPKSYHTARKWFDERNIPVPNVDSLKKKAADLNAFYNDSEKIMAAQSVIERAVDKLENDDTLDSDGINKLANAINRAVQTIQLIQGKATSINENHSKDGTDLKIQDLISSAQAKNAEKFSQIVSETDAKE